jgi:hypothetical protein
MKLGKAYYETCVTRKNNWLPTKILFTLLTELRLFDTMLNFVENLLENERDSRSGLMNDQDHSLSLSDTDRSYSL